MMELKVKKSKTLCKIKSYNFNFFVLVIMKYILYDEIVHNWNNKMNNIFAVIFSDDLLVNFSKDSV